MSYYRPAAARGKANFGWLDSKHTFSFGHYYDPNHMGVSALRVINDDTVAPGAGFDAHGHRDMEIVSYVLEGAVRHEDSMGNQYVVPAGDIQVMSAGSGIVHSEYNHSTKDAVRFLQIWITPNQKGAAPGYQQTNIATNGKLTPLATPDGRANSLILRQNASIYRVNLEQGETLRLGSIDQPSYLHLIDGQLSGKDVELSNADGFGQESGQVTEFVATKPVHALYFELP